MFALSSFTLLLGCATEANEILASERMNILHEGAARELGDVIGDDPGRDPEAAHQSFQELDS